MQSKQWKACGSESSLATWVEDETGKRVCTMKQAVEDWDRARLIAQAPDLLAERDRLKAINAELVAALAELAEIGAAGIISRQGTGIPAWNAFDAVKDIARAALARANKQHQSNDKEC